MTDRCYQDLGRNAQEQNLAVVRDRFVAGREQSLRFTFAGQVRVIEDLRIEGPVALTVALRDLWAGVDDQDAARRIKKLIDDHFRRYAEQTTWEPRP